MDGWEIMSLIVVGFVGLCVGIVLFGKRES
jgi:hypothetical protein